MHEHAACDRQPQREMESRTNGRCPTRLGSGTCPDGVAKCASSKRRYIAIW